jgi:hypothetical protein
MQWITRGHTHAYGATPLTQQLREYDDFLHWGVERARYPLLDRDIAFAIHQPSITAACASDADVCQ